MGKTKTFKEKNRRDGVLQKDFYKKGIVIGIIILVVLGVFFFAELKGVGKALESATSSKPFYNPTTGFTGEEEQGIVYYEAVPEEAVDTNDETCEMDTDENEGDWWCDDNCPYPNKQSATYCYSLTAKKWDCYAPFSVIRGKNQDSLCVDPENYGTYNQYFVYDSKGTYNGYNWLDCKGDIKKTTLLDGKFYCGNDKKILPCVEDYDGNVKPDTKNINLYVCNSDQKKWLTCDNKIASADKLQSEDKYLCWKNSSNVWKWDGCSTSDKGKSVDSSKFYCEQVSDKWKWKECKKNELSADGKAYL